MRTQPFAVVGVIFVAVFALLAGCARRGSATATDAPIAPTALTLRGSLTYLQRVALPPDAVAMVELRDAADAAGVGPVVGEERIELGGRQVPIPFDLTVTGDRLQANRSYALRGGILVSGRPTWVTEPVPVTARGGQFDLGELRLAPYTAVAFPTVFRCGEERVQFGFVDNEPSLMAGGKTYTLREVVSASGARYAAIGDATTGFWSKGDRARVTLGGRELPECVPDIDAPVAPASATPPAAAAAASFVARGNEPGWRVEVGERLKVSADYGKTTLDFPAPPAQSIQGGRRYVVTGATPVALTVLDRACADDMTGMPHPNTTELALGDRRLRGCGGDPASLLRGAEWTVTALDGQPVTEPARGTLRFGDDGRVAGRAFCNAFTAAYTLTGEGLSFTRAASTMMACAPGVSSLESKFNATLAAVSAFEIAPDGSLVLKAPNGQTIAARR